MTEAFVRRDGVLHAADVALPEVADRFGTPCYVYSAPAIAAAWDAFDDAFGARPHRVCYAVKANPLLAILELLAQRGSGFDVVSGGELQRVLLAGGAAHDVVFSGVGKTDAELRAALEAGIGCINVESGGELRRLEGIAAQLGCVAPVALRVNPDIVAATHPHVATGGGTHKFGISAQRIPRLAARAHASPNLALRGLAVHIGSQITDLEAFRAAAAEVGRLAAELAGAGMPLAHLDLGGGLAVGPAAPPIDEYVGALIDALPPSAPDELHIEPGRAIVARAGVLLTRVVTVKHEPLRSFAVVDGGMNDLLRPALYDAWHDIETVTDDDAPRSRYDVVGPVCETGDYLGRGRQLALRPGTLLAIREAGAYAASMASNYNSRPRPPEIMVHGNRIELARRREDIADLVRAEKHPDGRDAE